MGTSAFDRLWSSGAPRSTGPVYDKNGHPVVDTSPIDDSGHVPTHRLDQPTNRMPNESWTDYEDRVLGRTSFSPDTASTASLASLNPDVADSTRSLLSHAQRDGVPLQVAETKRSQERQEMLFQKGRSAPGGVVTWTLTSDHTPGRAVDFSGDPSALQWLQANAPTHGFSVMGSMDPGHVSMPSAPQPAVASSPAPQIQQPVVAQRPSFLAQEPPVMPGRQPFYAAEPPVMPSRQPFYAEAPPVMPSRQVVATARPALKAPVVASAPAPAAKGGDALDALWDHSQTAEPAAPRSTVYNALQTVNNALTAGFGPKFTSAYNAVGDAITGRDSFAHSYTKNLDADQAGIQDFRAKNPYSAAALSAGGAVGQIALAAPLIASGEIANGLTMGQRAAAAARTGGTFGAVGALGNAPNRGGFVDNALIAAKGGVVGAGIGAAAVPLSQGAAKIIGRVGPATQRLVQRAGADVASSPPLAQVAAAPAEVLGANGGAAVPPTAPPSAVPGMPSPQPEVDRATQILLRRLQRTGLTPQEAMDRLAQIPADKPVSIMEVAGEQSHPLRQLGKWVARTQSTGASQLRAAIADRMTPLPNAQRVLGDVSEAMGQGRVNLLDNAETLKGQQLAKAQPFYDAAFGPSTPPVPLSSQIDENSPTLGDLMKRPSIKSAIKFHNDIALERGEQPLTLPAEEAAPTAAAPQPSPSGATPDAVAMYQRLSQMNGANKEATAKALQALGYSNNEIAAMRGVEASAAPSPSAPSAIPLKTLQKIKFKLDDALGFAKRNGQLPDGTPATNAKLGAINNTRKALLDIMTAHSPDYAQGNSIWAGDAAEQEAGEQGKQFLSRPIDELQRSVPAMTRGEVIQHHTAAVSGPLRDRIFNTSAVDRAKIFSNPDIQERLQTVISEPRMATLAKKLGYEHQIALTNQGVTGGSDTAENLANDADVSGAPAKSLISGLAMGRPRRILTGVVRSVVNPAVDAWVRGINEQTANALAPKLTAGMKGRPEMNAFLDELATAFDRMQRTRGSLPYAGAAAGTATASLLSRQP